MRAAATAHVLIFDSMKKKLIDYIRNKVINRLLTSRLARRFQASPAPWWAVWTCDIVIVMLSALLTLAMHGNSTRDMPGVIYTSGAKVIFVAMVYSLTSIIFKSHRYIVRLSAVSDVARTMKLVATASIVLIIVSFVSQALIGVRYISIWNIVMAGVTAFAMMIVVRLVIKYLYNAMQSRGLNRKSVIILGTSIKAVSLATALREEVGGQYEPVALLNLGRDERTSVGGLPIELFSPATISQTFNRYGCDTVMFTTSQLRTVKGELADCFIQAGIHMLLSHGVDEFKGKDEASASASVRNIHIEDLLGRDTIRTQNPRIKGVFRNQTVLVTGAAGSIGSEIATQLARLGTQSLVLIDQAETPMHELQLRMREEFPSLEIHYFVGDITNRERMEMAFAKYKPRYVFHAAAYKHVPMMENNPSEAVGTNVFGTRIIADLAVAHNVEKLVMVSTDKAVNPTNIMGATKRIAEIYVQSLFFHNRHMTDGVVTQFITTRFGNVLGSNGSVIPLFKRQIEEGGPITVTHRDIIRYFMTIPEACSLVLEAACMGRGGEIYVFDMGKPVKIYDMARKMISLAGLRPDVDIKIVETGLRPGEKLYEELLSDRENTTATMHSQIMVAKVVTYDYNAVQEQLRSLSDCLHSGNLHDIVAQMKRIVPEYHSNNSRWENIDREIAIEREQAQAADNSQR